jgi:glycosyltransferase involved in cell wall biosynthesis
LDGTVTFVGYQADPLAWLAAADLFVLPSMDEGYPVALMEALAMGVPVVATAVGGVADAIRPSVDGVLVPPGDPGALARAIIVLSADANRRGRMSLAAAKGAARYDIARAMTRIEGLYSSLLGS